MSDDETLLRRLAALRGDPVPELKTPSAKKTVDERAQDAEKEDEELQRIADGRDDEVSGEATLDEEDEVCSGRQ